MGSTATNHALVFGASGITGWAIVNAILNDYPAADTFSKVTALTNRPLTPEQAQWPQSDKLQLASGVDLQSDASALEAELRSRIPDIETVSVVYFFAYIMDMTPATEIAINVQILRNAVSVVEKISPNLKFVVLPTGTKAYGVHLVDEFPWKNELPLKESLPRIPEPHASQMFYYNQLDLLKELSAGKEWSYCSVMPDVIVGFVPNNNVYCLAQWLSIYLSIYREINGEGAEVVFPGTMESWKIKSNDSSQDIIARFAIHASLNPGVSAEQDFNTADHSRPSSWSAKWPIICDYFGLKGVAPEKGSGPDPARYIMENQAKWVEMETKFGLRAGHVGKNERSFQFFPYFIMTMFNFDRQLDMGKMHAAWGTKAEEINTQQAWYTAFDRFRKAKIIP
ncbi:hypothetical protein FE257_010359 [Aspergillus nanangensis]|uniref:PRISE-like Rossmann-fold domain-containing protein n=1 Tax=Aspergillus nanangensis TaxID=2582783 RepID=A0AAD4GS48_ASPNN|nr:hypothetical protein FE257_010359 [Aspergillus nanangensis]